MENNDEKKSPLFKLQYMGYFLAGLDTSRGDFKLDDLVNIAKFSLCQERGYLMKDPIWEDYSSEELLKEYYASLYTTNKEAREAFEVVLASNEADDEWMESQIRANRKRKQDKSEKDLKMEEEVTFDPSEETLGE